MFLAVLEILGVGFLVLTGIVMLRSSSIFGKSIPGDFPFPFWIMTIIYWIMAVINFFSVALLTQFSSKMKEALQYNHLHSLTYSFENMSKHYKFLGIAMRVMIVMYIIFIITILGFALSAAIQIYRYSLLNLK
jgi:hypothetical protein